MARGSGYSVSGLASSPSGGGGGDLAVAGFDVRTNLRQLLADLKAFDPQLATEVRRRMRKAGDATIAEMGRLLDDYQGGVVAGKTHAMGTDRAGRTRRVVDGLDVKGAGRTRSRGAREEVKAGLKLRVTAGTRRTTIRLVATRGDLRMALNGKTWRHPVFGDDRAFVEQPGNQYFNRGVWSQADSLREELEAAIQVALDALATSTTITE